MVIMIFYEETELLENIKIIPMRWEEKERKRDGEGEPYKFQFWQNNFAIFVDILHKSQSMFIPFSFCQYEECLF